MGNQTPEDAQKLVQELEDTLGLKCPLKELPAFEEAELLPGATLWSLESTDKDDPNHAVVLRWQFGRGVEEACFVMVLNKILSSKFFDLLRTQQQLGYIVGMGASPSNHFTYLVAQVQTEFPPDYARSRMDAFFAENFAWLEEGLEEEEFQRCLQGVLSELKMKPKNLSEEFNRVQGVFQKRSYEFDRRDRKIAFLESGAVSRASLGDFVKGPVRTAPKLYVQVRKVLDKEDKPLPEGAVVPEDPPELRHWRGYAEGIRERSMLRTWHCMNTKIEAFESEA
ncbi:unnamed protein product [Effrenium voratum]|nr:unnamed protein product [Effrenium voratum]